MLKFNTFKDLLNVFLGSVVYAVAGLGTEPWVLYEVDKYLPLSSVFGPINNTIHWDSSGA